MSKGVTKILKKAFHSVESAPTTVAHAVTHPASLAKNVGNLATLGIPAAVDQVQKTLTPKIPKPGDVNVNVPEAPVQARDAQIVADQTPTPEFGGSGEAAGLQSKRRGRKSLRIDLRTGNAGAGGSGLNIPRG